MTTKLLLVMQSKAPGAKPRAYSWLSAHKLASGDEGDEGEYRDGEYRYPV